MKIDMIPFNIDLLIPTKDMLRLTGQVKALDIFEGSSRNFHPEGLFSTEIFGRSGDERRNRRFGYIDLKIPLFHPLIYKALEDLKGLYGEIMAGKSYAIFDETIHDFIKASPLQGQTGYAFFVSRFKEIEFEHRPSTRREFYIKLVEKYREHCMIDKLIVLPAGLRDYIIDEGGKPSKDEVNDYYWKILSLSSLITDVSIRLNPESTDQTRYNLQLGINDLFAHFRSLLEGKKKLILGRWAARKINNGTRNVITAIDNDTSELNSNLTMGANDTAIGLYQYLKANLPISLHQLRNGILSKIFLGPNSPAVLVNKKTLHKEMITVKPGYYDKWMTDEGLEKILNQFGNEDLRHNILEAEDHYFCLLYNDKKHYRVLQDINELPEGWDKSFVRPITYAELLYLSVYKTAHETPIFMTRYPVINYGGIYPSYCFLKTTINFQTLKELGDDWKETGQTALQFPITGEQFMNSLCPAFIHLGRSGADFDGDTMSGNTVYTDEAKAEVRKLVNSRMYYIGPNGKLNFNPESDVAKLVLKSTTGKRA